MHLPAGVQDIDAYLQQIESKHTVGAGMEKKVFWHQGKELVSQKLKPLTMGHARLCSIETLYLYQLVAQCSWDSLGCYEIR